MASPFRVPTDAFNVSAEDIEMHIVNKVLPIEQILKSFQTC